MLRLHNTALGRVTELKLRDPGKVALYVCGPTVYGAAHVGHGRTTLVYDVLRRYLAYRGLEVNHVSNVTDIDDKIINRAHYEARSWREVASECEAQWWRDMDAMGVLRPTEIPRATEYLEAMVEFVKDLVVARKAYETSDGVYLATDQISDYGLLAHQGLDTLLPGARVDLIEEKRSFTDFTLWKKVKPGEPSWSSPYGAGRPGWHTECVVMSLGLLGEGFDLHGGGQDLIFPHHENERAQAVALDRRFAGHWAHSGLVTVSGEKMSKSLGNFTTLRELLERTDPRAYRLLVLRAHYRSPLEVNEETLTDAAKALGRLDALARRLGETTPSVKTPECVRLEERFVEAMDDDLDTPRALAGLFEALRRANAQIDAGDAVGGAALGQTLLRIFAAVGVDADTQASIVDELVLDLAARRDLARAARDFTLADSLRLEIEGRGFALEDTAEGTRIPPSHRR